eukprot:scaffold632538_cov36-Prasinocladus_malaysianus.AAC.1
MSGALQLSREFPFRNTALLISSSSSSLSPPTSSPKYLSILFCCHCQDHQILMPCENHWQNAFNEIPRVLRHSHIWEVSSSPFGQQCRHTYVTE